MLLNRVTAEGIADGTITLVLRRWDAPRAKRGGTQRTPVGTARFKRRVRQLKALGLTTSLDVGYRVSPRGRAYLRATD